MTITPVKRALLSVSNKEGIVEFAEHLSALGIEIVSTGGTSKLLREAGIQHRQVEEMTHLPDMLDGRVKTLHPKIHGGILGRRDQHAKEAAQHGIDWIDLIVVNFYPFADIRNNTAISWEEAVEYIDIGGPTMVRAAAKNFAWVSVVVEPSDYPHIISTLRTQHGIDAMMRQTLAEKAFALTYHYDAMIHDFFLLKPPKINGVTENVLGNELIHLSLKKYADLRYGENPHQKACAYRFDYPSFKQTTSGVLSACQHQGKPLSYNNILDAEAALACIREFTTPTCVIVKHANPCGVASALHLEEAFARAYQADSVSAFGGIVALNEPCTETIAAAMKEIFMEVILAPSYTKEALAIFAAKPNLRVLELTVQQSTPAWEMKFVTDGVLLQEKDSQVLNESDLTIVTQLKPESKDMATLLFAWHVLKHVKSNGIVIAKENATVGIGAGQVSRIDAVDIAIRKSGEHILDTVLASDAFFPFRDSIDRLAKTGVRAIIQPGGSVRDDEVIAACNEHHIAMVFTGKRCFKH